MLCRPCKEQDLGFAITLAKFPITSLHAEYTGAIKAMPANHIATAEVYQYEDDLLLSGLRILGIETSVREC